MALTAKQRNALPDSAFVYRRSRMYPVPTKAQARKAGISERQRLGLHRNARVVLGGAAEPSRRRVCGRPAVRRVTVRVADIAMVVIAVFVVLAYFNGWGG